MLPDCAVPAWRHPTSRAYLQRRGLTQDDADSYDLAYADAGLWHGRVLIPMYQGDELVAFQGRSVQEDHPVRYLTEGHRPLYCPWELADVVIPYDLCVVEGPFDLMAVQRVCPTVAVLGNQISPRQWRTLCSLVTPGTCRAVWIWYDREALTEAFALQIRLAPLVETHVIDEPPEKDPALLADPARIQAVFEYHARSE